MEDIKNSNNKNLISSISTILFLYNNPINLDKIKYFLGDENISIEDIKDSLFELDSLLSNIGLALVKTENKDEQKVEFIISTKGEFSGIAKAIKKDELYSELTPASLQVLTICAYLGPSTKNEISFIRGVQSSQSIRSLSARGLLKRIGDKYSLSIEAIQKLGVTRLEELPEYEKIKVDFTERLRDVLKDEE